MSAHATDPTTPAAEPTEEQLRAYEEELARITSTQLALQAAASLLNLGGRKLGLAPGLEGERDLEQVRDAVDSVMALVPILERRLPGEQVRPLRDALSQLQMAYARLASESASTASAAEASPSPAQRTSPSPSGPSQSPPGAPEPPSVGPQPQRPAGADSSQTRPEAPAKQGPGPAERSGKLWVPGR